MKPDHLRHLSPKIWANRFHRLKLWRRNRHRAFAYGKITNLQGQAFADAANEYCRLYYDGLAHITYEPEASTYLLNSDPEYRFSSPARLQYFVQGLDWRGSNLHHEYLLSEIKFADGDKIVESGGNDGDFSLALKQLSKRLSLVSFEPAPREFEALSINLKKMEFFDEVQLHNKALWNKSGDQLEFYIKSATADSSVLPIDDATEVILVDTVRLDEVLERQPYKLLKLEAEGAEPEILEGAAGIIDCFEYISAEVGFERGVKQESTLPEVSNFLIRNGFHAKRVQAGRLVILFERDGRYQP